MGVLCGYWGRIPSARPGGDGRCEVVAWRMDDR
jgi:hypothetical protein